MTRGMSLTLLLMVASMAAATASPGGDAPAAPWACVERKAAHAAPSAALAPVPTVAAGGLRPLAAPCAADPGQVYRQWHHAGSKLGVDCVAGDAVAPALARGH